MLTGTYHCVSNESIFGGVIIDNRITSFEFDKEYKIVIPARKDSDYLSSKRGGFLTTAMVLKRRWLLFFERLTRVTKLVRARDSIIFLSPRRQFSQLYRKGGVRRDLGSVQVTLS